MAHARALRHRHGDLLRARPQESLHQISPRADPQAPLRPLVRSRSGRGQPRGLRLRRHGGRGRRAPAHDPLGRPGLLAAAAEALQARAHHGRWLALPAARPAELHDLGESPGPPQCAVGQQPGRPWRQRQGRPGRRQGPASRAVVAALLAAAGLRRQGPPLADGLRGAGGGGHRDPTERAGVYHDPCLAPRSPQGQPHAVPEPAPPPEAPARESAGGRDG
mmetsp:Transcript_48405/g.149537  ORF Transcript_48405/g.149537 Transcript_48405/m.149537 type:complete len:220 (-) Transcript_48405:484-1143(-)